MSAGDAPRVELPPEFRSALEKLHRLFAGALHDAKFNSCWAAWTDIRRTKSAKKKIEILNERFEQWREGSVNAIREWLPKFVDLATAYPEVIDDDPIHWAKDRVWETVEGVCGIQRGPEGEPLPIDCEVNDITVWWIAVASEGNPAVNLPPLRPRVWSAPRWLARGRQETSELLEKYTRYLWPRVNLAITEAIDLAEIHRASNCKVEEHEADPPEGGAGATNFSASEDYRSIRYKGAAYALTRNQSTIIRLLHEAYLKGTPALGNNTLLRALEAETSRVRDSFKNSPLWRTLIVANRSPRGTYQLNLE